MRVKLGNSTPQQPPPLGGRYACCLGLWACSAVGALLRIILEAVVLSLLVLFGVSEVFCRASRGTVGQKAAWGRFGQR